jgi:hypothetical protein
VPPRIFPGPWNLDKLPAWLTIPVGGMAGAVAGYRIGQSEHSMMDIAMLVVLAVIVLWCGASAQRAIPIKPRAPRSNKS